MNKEETKEIKEKILNELEDSHKLKCPFCNGDRFLRSAFEKPIIVEIFDDGNSIRDEELQMNSTEYTYICKNCGKDVTNKELK